MRWSSAQTRFAVVAVCAVGSLGGAVRVGAWDTGEEIRLARRFELQARARLPLVSDVEALEYVSRIGGRIVASLGPQPISYRFYVTRDARVNAFAVPGGVIYVNAGLLLRAESDDEVAGVLGHEIAHVHAHHLARQQEATQILNYTSLLGILLSTVQPAVGAGAVALQAATQLRYQREFEQEADYQGARFMKQAGFNPRGMLQFFRKLSEDQRGSAAVATPYLLSHPLTETRLANLEALLKEHGWEGTSQSSPNLLLARVQVRLRTLLEPAADVVEQYRRRAAEKPEDAASQYLWGLALLFAGQPDLAMTAFEKARELGLTNGEREIGRAWLARRDPAKAAQWLLQAVEKDPQDAVAHYELAQALRALGEDGSAEHALERAVALVPNFEEATQALGTLAGRRGEEAKGLYYLGRAAYLRGDLEQAVSYWERALPLWPGDSERGAEIREALAEMRTLRR
ncbi:MAG: M48 family metalloprotease [Candidatus Binatia bacterium]|nr:M48 family metalloprotease [Candidatus Binatia bacterium]